MTIADELLQKVASGQDVLLVEMRQMRDAHGQLAEEFQMHRRDDREDFNRVFALMEMNRKDRNDQYDKIFEAMSKRIDTLETALKDQINTSNRARGAIWVITGIMAFLGAAFLSFGRRLWGGG